MLTRPRRPSAPAEPPDAPAASWWADLLVLAVLAALVAGVVRLAGDWTEARAPLESEPVEIDLSPAALVGYAFRSLSRGFAAYGLSLVFTLVYGGIAAHSRRAEKVMIPVLDILQGIPVLGFMPGLVLGMVALFPGSNLGLELACVLMIFTAQVWNMTFAFYGSLRAVPAEMREVASLAGFGWWKTFRTVEVPFAAIPLIWNSMMSMAGGWFFLTVNEAFRLGDRDFRLPGIGSYMSVAIDRGDGAAMLYAVAAMIIMIAAVDHLLWRPLIVWAQKFKTEESGGEPTRSWMLDLLARSRLLHWLRDLFDRRGTVAAADAPAGTSRSPPRPSADRWAAARPWAGRGVVTALAALSFWGAWGLGSLLLQVPAADWLRVVEALFMTFLRTTAAVLIGAAWAVPAGILIGRSPVWSRRLQPIVQVVASFPAPMLFPIVTAALLWAGLDFGIGAVALMLLGAQWYILFNVIAGAQAIPGDLREAAEANGLRGRALWRTLYLPGVFPALVTGLITAAGGAWNASIVSELVRFQGRTYEAFGLGSLITVATESGNYPLLTAGVLTMSAMLVLLNRLVWKRLYRLADTRFALNR